MKLHPWEELELQALVEEACDLRDAGSPYFADACQAIGAWRDRRLLARWERRQQLLATEIDRLVIVLRETDPDRSWRNAEAGT